MAGSVAGLMIARNIASTKEGIDAARESWKTLDARGLTLSFEEVGVMKAPTGKERPVLKGTVGGVPVEVHIHTDVVHCARTEVTATRAAAFDGKVGLHRSPGGVLGYLRSWIGQDILIGDEVFDEAYLITGKPEAAAKSLLVPSVRELAAALGDKLAGFTVEGSSATVILNGAESDADAIHAAASLAAAGATWVNAEG